LTPRSSRIRRHRKGHYEIRLSPPERDLLRSLGPQMRDLLSSSEPDPALARLFPEAYPHNPDRQEEYRLLVHDELEAAYLAALQTLETTVDAERLSEEEAAAWVRAINEVRLVLGTRLEVTEEGDERPESEDDPRAPGFAVYDYLTWLQGELIDALSG
jgi:hypothetical protein